MGLHQKRPTPSDADDGLPQLSSTAQEVLNLALLPTFAKPGELTELPVSSLAKHGHVPVERNRKHRAFRTPERR